MAKDATKSSFFDKLPPSMIRKSNVTIFPEGALGYLVGPTLALLANSILSNYFNAYMSNVLNINAWASAFFTSLPVISVIFVVLGNIIVGRLMDKNTSKAGKARPLLLISVPISLIALVILFIISPFVTDTVNTNSQVMALVCIAIGYNLWFAIAYPMYYTPHASLVNLSTRNSKDRSLLATISNATALAAMGLTSMILPFFLRLLFVYDMSGKGTPVTNDAGVIEYYTDEAGAVLYDAQASYSHWKIFVIALIIITLVGALIEYFFTRERVTEESTDVGEVKKALPIGEQAKICFSDKFWIIMIAFFFLYQLGGMMKNVSQLYFCQAMFADSYGNYTTAYGGQLQGLLSIIGAVPTAVGMVIAWPLSNKIGKGKAILSGAVLAVLGGVLGLMFPTNFPIVVTSFVIKALGSTPAMYLSLALLADILDHQEALHGARTDGFTMTIYGAIMAGMTGIATGIMNGVLSGLGYSTSNISSEAIRSAMPWIFIGGETIFYAVIFLTFLFMKVERFGALDHRAIVADQKAAAEKEGREYISHEEKIRREEGEEAYQAELKKQADAKAAEEARIAKLTPQQKKVEEEAAAKLLAEFNALRKINGRTELV